jgi:hypothetical protein
VEEKFNLKRSGYEGRDTYRWARASSRKYRYHRSPVARLIPVVATALQQKKTKAIESGIPKDDAPVEASTHAATLAYTQTAAYDDNRSEIRAFRNFLVGHQRLRILPPSLQPPASGAG